MASDGDDANTSAGIFRAIADLDLEDGSVRSPLAGLFPIDMPTCTLEECMDAITDILPLWHSESKNVKIALSKAKKVIKKYTWMSRDEIGAVVIYTMECKPREESVYYAMNQALRNKDRNAVKPWRDYIWLLLHGLQKIPACKHTNLYRGSKSKPSDMGLDDLDKGDDLTWSAFSSAATSVDVMNTFLGEEGNRTMVHMSVTPGVGREVADFSLFPDEHEVLLPPNVRFEFESKYQPTPGFWMIQLSQVESFDELLDLSGEGEKTKPVSGSGAKAAKAISSKKEEATVSISCASSSVWIPFFEKIKSRPASFYARCIDVLEAEDIYEPEDLKGVSPTWIEGLDVTEGQKQFLLQALSFLNPEADEDKNAAEDTARKNAGMKEAAEQKAKKESDEKVAAMKKAAEEKTKKARQVAAKKVPAGEKYVSETDGDLLMTTYPVLFSWLTWQGAGSLFHNGSKDFGVAFDIRSTSDADLVVNALWFLMGQNAYGHVKVYTAEGGYERAGSSSDQWTLHCGPDFVHFSYRGGMRKAISPPLEVKAGVTLGVYVHCDYKSWDPLMCGVIYRWPTTDEKGEPCPNALQPTPAVDANLSVAETGVAYSSSPIPFKKFSDPITDASLPLMIEYKEAEESSAAAPTFLTNDFGDANLPEIGFQSFGYGESYGFGFKVGAKAPHNIKLCSLSGLHVRDWSPKHCGDVEVWVYEDMTAEDQRVDFYSSREPPVGPKHKHKWKKISAVSAEEGKWLEFCPPIVVAADTVSCIMLGCEFARLIPQRVDDPVCGGETEHLILPAGGFTYSAEHAEDPFKEVKEGSRQMCYIGSFNFHGMLKYRLV